MINHRYNILNKLGEGGSGEVFFVEDTLKQKQQLAMKVLHRTEGSDGNVDEQFKSEMAFLATLHHPNLVRIFDFGMIRRAEPSSLEGRKFYTMEYVQGVDALQWCRARQSAGERSAHVRQIALQALGVLSLIHQRGIIHFDIKPENLLLVSGFGESDLPFLKLMDFGLSIKRDASRDISLRGTLEYTAPELLLHEAFDHRVDLYSLGATLYHLLEGHCPFEAERSVDLVKMIFNNEPDFVRASGSFDAGLLSLMKNLLQKDPDRRFRTAEEAARSLGAGKTDLGGLSFQPLFVGRRREQEQIAAAIDSLGSSGAGNNKCLIMLVGPEGIGKTALLDECARYGRVREVPVLELSPYEGRVPFGAIGSMLALLQAEVLSRSSEGKALAERFADAIDPVAHPLEGSDVTLQRETRARFLIQSSSLFPIIVVADDLDQLDQESVHVLQIAARDAQPGSLLILGSAKVDGHMSFGDSHIMLEELTVQDVREMSASLFSLASPDTSRSVLPAAIGDSLFRLYGGTPALVVEALRSVGLLLPPELNVPEAEIPEFVETIVGQIPRDIEKFLVARYEGLDKERSLVLSILSCFQAPARLDIIQATLPFQSERTGHYLSSLEAGGLLISTEGGQRFSMRHAKLRSIVYALAEGMTRDIHSFIASTMESLPGAKSLPDMEEIAFQYAGAGKGAHAARWYASAAEESMRLAAFTRAVELYGEAINQTPAGELQQVLELKVKHTTALFHAGQYRETIDAATGLLTAQGITPALQAALREAAGLSHSRLGNYGEAREYITAALAGAEVLSQLEMLQELVAVEIGLGNFVDAERECMAQLERARGIQRPAILGSIYTNLGIATFYQEKFDRSVEWFQHAMEIYSETGQHARQADALMNIGNVLSAKGDMEAAIQCWQKALPTCKEYGTLNQQARIQNNLGIAYYKLKQYLEAKQFYAEAKSIFARIDSKEGTAYVLTNLGEVCYAEGEYEKALSLWGDARAYYGEMDDAQGLVESMLQLAQVCQVLGDEVSMKAHLHEAEKLIHDRDFETFRAQLHYLQGMLHLSQNSFDSARELFAAAIHSPGGGEGQKLSARVRLAECEYRCGNHESAAKLAREALEAGEKEASPLTVADALLLLGQIAGASPADVDEKPLMLYKRGFETIVNEPVTELTWKLAFALGREFHERGQMERAKEFLTRAKVVLEFFLGQFTSADRRRQYLLVDRKDKVLGAIEMVMSSSRSKDTRNII